MSFRGDQAGQVLADIDLISEGQVFAWLPWLGEEDLHDARCFNANLASMPYKHWTDQAR